MNPEIRQHLVQLAWAMDDRLDRIETLITQDPAQIEPAACEAAAASMAARDELTAYFYAATVEHSYWLACRVPASCGYVLTTSLNPNRYYSARMLWEACGLHGRDIALRYNQRTDLDPDSRLLHEAAVRIGRHFAATTASEFHWVYQARLEHESAQNETGTFAGIASKYLSADPKATAEDRAAWIQGRLPVGHLTARARRWAVRAFIQQYAIERARGLGKAPPIDSTHFTLVDLARAGFPENGTVYA